MTIVFVSCIEADLKDKFIGKWAAADQFYGVKEFKFHKDSLTIYEEGQTYYGLWNADETKIYITRNNPRTLELIEQITLEYKFSRKKDSLFFKRETDTSFFEYPVLIKIHRDWIKSMLLKNKIIVILGVSTWISATQLLTLMCKNFCSLKPFISV
jgi:hypothetical protein